MKPTQGQIKEFWERCGIKENHCDMWAKGYPCYDSLDDLFKYAVPFYIRHYEDKGMHTASAWQQLFAEWLNMMVEHIGNYPAPALFWAIWEAIHE